MARLLIFLIGSLVFAQQNQYVLVPSSTGNTGRLVFRERAANGTNEVRLKAPDNITANVDFTMPATDGGVDFSIATDGAGILSFKEMVSAFSTGATVQTIASDKYFASGLRTLDFEVRNTVSSPLVIQGYVTAWDSGALEMFSSGGILTLAMMSESGGVGGPGMIEMYHPSTGLETLSLDSRGWIEMSQIVTPSASGGGRNRLYFKSTGQLCSVNNAGVEVCYGAGVGTPSLEMPVDFTVSGITRARMWNASGNVSLYLNNSSGFTGVNLSNFAGGSEIRLVDTNGESNAMLRTGGSNGATLDLYADNSTTRTGVLIEGGQFVTGGSVKTFSLSSALVNRLDDNGLLTTTAEARTLKLSGSLSGSISLTVPAITSTYALSLPGASGLTGQCPVLSSPSVLAWSTCITSLAGVFELPINFTVSGVTRATMDSFSGNAYLDLKNSSNVNGASIGNGPAGGFTLLTDISGVGFAHMGTDSSNGAFLKLFARNTSRVGTWIEGGTFTGGGIISTYDVASTLINKLDSNGLLTTTAQAQTLRLTSAFGGSVSFTIPTAASYSFVFPATAGTSGQCFQMSASPPQTVWATCGSGSFVDLTTAQTVGGAKFFSAVLRSQTLAASTVAGGPGWFQAYTTGSTYGVAEVWSSTGGSFPTVQLLGNYAGNGIGAIEFANPSGGAATIRINGGSSGFNPSIDIKSPSTGSNQLRAYWTSGSGGNLDIYTSGGTRVFAINGTSGGTLQVHDGVGLVSGITGTLDTHAGCIIDVVDGVITGSSGC